MTARTQRRTFCLLILLALVGLPCLLIWRELREDRLSAQLMATVKHVQALAKVKDNGYEDETLRKEVENQTRIDEAQAIRLLEAGADPNVRDLTTLKRSFWEEMKFLLDRMRRHPSGAASLPPSALSFAVHANDTPITTALLKAGADDVNAEIQKYFFEYRFPLVNYSASVGNLEITKGLCAQGADLHKLNSQGEPVLLSALAGDSGDRYLAPVYKDTGAPGRQERDRRTEIFHLLLANGAKYEAKSQEGHRLLLAATARDLREVSRELLAAGAPPNTKPEWLNHDAEYSPLDNAVDNDDIPLVELLLQYNAATRSTDAESPMLFVRSPQAAKLLLAHGATLDAELKGGKFQGQNTLDCACTRGDTQVVAFFIEHGFDVKQDGGPILLAVRYGGIETVRLLLKHGAKVGPNTPAADALSDAIAGSNDDIARLLLRHGAAVNTKRYPPLTAAAEQDDLEMATELLKRGANAKADKGKALLAACKSCDEDLVELLLEHGADPTVRSEDGSTTIQLVKQNEDPPGDADGVVALLKEYGAKE